MTRQLATPQLTTDDSLRSREAEPQDGPAMAHAAVCLAELERSLEASRRALLARDLQALEGATREQIGLQRSLEILWPQTRGPGSHGAAKPDPTQIDSTLAASLRAAQWRVLYLGRVQAALLTRAQRSLRIVCNRLAGPEASYARPASNQARWIPEGSGNERPGEERPSKEQGKDNGAGRNSDAADGDDQVDLCRA